MKCANCLSSLFISPWKSINTLSTLKGYNPNFQFISMSGWLILTTPTGLFHANSCPSQLTVSLTGIKALTISIAMDILEEEGGNCHYHINLDLCNPNLFANIKFSLIILSSFWDLHQMWPLTIQRWNISPISLSSFYFYLLSTLLIVFFSSMGRNANVKSIESSCSISHQ